MENPTEEIDDRCIVVVTIDQLDSTLSSTEADREFQKQQRSVPTWKSAIEKLKDTSVVDKRFCAREVKLFCLKSRLGKVCIFVCVFHKTFEHLY